MSQVLQCTQFAALIFNFRRGTFLRHLIHRRRTKILAGISVLLHAFRRADIQIVNFQMAWLIVIMPRAGVIDIRQSIERQLAVAFKSLWRGPAIDFAVRLISCVRAHWINESAPAGDLLERAWNKPAEHSVLERLMEIPHLPQLFFDVTLLDLFFGNASVCSIEVSPVFNASKIVSAASIPLFIAR